MSNKLAEGLRLNLQALIARAYPFAITMKHAPPNSRVQAVLLSSQEEHETIVDLNAPYKEFLVRLWKAIENQEGYPEFLARWTHMEKGCDRKWLAIQIVMPEPIFSDADLRMTAEHHRELLKFKQT